MGIKELILNKGWAGRTLSRHETVDRLNPVIESLTRLMHVYDAALPALDDEDRRVLETTQKTLRTDIGRLSESVLSAGGVAYSGVDIEPVDAPTGDDPLPGLVREEDSFRDVLAGEKKVEHQIRTRAVLETVARNSSDRLARLRELQTRPSR